MRSLRTILIALYVICATASSAVLFVMGYVLLEHEVVENIDRLLTQEFQLIEARIGDAPPELDAVTLERRLHDASEAAATLFYIEVENPNTRVSFRSSNLQGRGIPDIPGKRVYDAVIPDFGSMRVREFLLPHFDVTIATPTKQIDQAMQAYREVYAALLFLMLFASLIIGSAFSSIVLRPIRLISDTARRIHVDNMSERIIVGHTRDELADLAHLLNATFDRIEVAFDQVRRFSDEASHELKTPLSLIRLHAERMLAEGTLSAAHSAVVGEQLDEVHHLNHIIDDLLFLSRAEAGAVALQTRHQDATEFLENFAQDAQVLAQHFGCRFVLSTEGVGRVTFDSRWIRQVLLNGLMNALGVSPRDGLVTLASVVGPSRWRVSISDEGPGLSAQERERMFERFVRFKAPSTGERGSGLGLAICRKIIELHHGRIFAEPNAVGPGLRLSFELPT